MWIRQEWNARSIDARIEADGRDEVSVLAQVEGEAVAEAVALVTRIPRAIPR